MDISNLFSLSGRTALVTGGSRGIGRMIAAGFIAAGAKVYISSRKAEACEATARELGENCIPLPADVGTIEGGKTLTRLLSRHQASLDILVNNAGATWGAPLADFPEHGWDKVMDLNVKSPFFLTLELLPFLRAAARPEKPAKIINIASVDGLRVSPWETYSYHASKAGLIHLTRRLAAQLAPDHISVNAIAPGAFASAMNKAARDHADVVANAIPAHRVGDELDMAGAALFLAARSGDYVMGDTLVVDGGLVNASLGPSIDVL